MFAESFFDELEKVAFFGKKEKEAKKEYESVFERGYKGESDAKFNARRKELRKAILKRIGLSGLGGAGLGAAIGAGVGGRGGALAGAGLGGLAGAVGGEIGSIRQLQALGMRNAEMKRRLKATGYDA